MSSPVEVIFNNTTLDEAWQLSINKRYRHLPVVNQQFKPVGIISDRDLLKEKLKATPSKFASDVMKKQLLTSSSDTTVREIARILFEERIGSMPIVDNHDKIIGILTRSDILRECFR